MFKSKNAETDQRINYNLILDEIEKKFPLHIKHAYISQIITKKTF